jgi:ABC-type dipeptide/oligopeptide/nickel transport system permease subunit
MATSAHTAETTWEKQRIETDQAQVPTQIPSTFASGRLGNLRRRASPSLWIGGGLVALLLLTALLASALAPYPSDLIMAEARLQAPSLTHPFGTDSFGRDLFSRVIHGARLAVEMALLGVGLAAAIGVTLGVLAGYYGEQLDQLLSRAMEVWMAFPGLLLALIIVARLGPSLRNATIALGIVSVPSFYRLARCGALSVREAAYVEAARALGVGDGRILLRHVLPNVAPSLIVLATMRLGTLLLAGGGLSFIGLGAQTPQPEWGALLADGRDYMDAAPWLAIFPGLCITLSVVGLNLLGDGLRDLSDPR